MLQYVNKSLFYNSTVCPVCPVTSLCELISRDLDKIERIHNMPRKAEHLSFQGKKRFWKSEHGLRRYCIFCAVTPILSVRSPLWKNVEKRGNFKKCKNWRCNFAYNSLVYKPIFEIFFSSESCHAKLSDKKRIFEIDSETWELWLKNVSARTKSE